MIHKLLALLFCSLIVFGGTATGCKKKNGKEIIISGSRTMEQALASLAESYNKNQEITITIITPGSVKGLALLSEGRCDIASSSVKMPAQMAWVAQKEGIAVKELIIAYDIIVPIVHPSNQVKNLFQGQMADMYSGLIKDWKAVEVKPGKIIVVDRDDDSGTRLFMNERFFELKKPIETGIKVKSDADAVAYVGKHPSSVGYVSKRHVNGTVKAIAINGFSGTLENVEKSYYPLCRELYFYTTEKKHSVEVQSFIDFCMTKEGQNIIEKAGFIPVERINKISK